MTVYNHIRDCDCKHAVVTTKAELVAPTFDSVHSHMFDSMYNHMHNCANTFGCMQRVWHCVQPHVSLCAATYMTMQTHALLLLLAHISLIVQPHV
jgi:hypothetical protein